MKIDIKSYLKIELLINLFQILFGECLYFQTLKPRNIRNSFADISEQF